MAVMIIKNGKVEKTFKKFFNCFVRQEMENWVNSHFAKAKKKVVDIGSRTIYIYY